LKSHNINPHSGGNQPEYKQVFKTALIAAAQHDDIIHLEGKSPIRKKPIVRQPILPRKLLQEEAKNIEQGEQIKADLNARNPIMPDKFLD
jgi:hypothetical protein